MNSVLEKTLRQRISDNECIICGKSLEKQPIIVLTHAVLGEIFICEEHIKQSGNNA